ncbi:MAG: hypothetical protein WAT79_08625 [Saprospiraceae bacterium]
MKQSFILFIFCILSSILYCQDTTSITLKAEKVKNMLLASERGKIAEQQVQSFLNMDSIYMDLSREFKTTVSSQQNSISTLVNTNTIGVQVIENGLKNIRSDFKTLGETVILKNLWLEDRNKELEKKVSNKNKIILALTTVLSMGVVALAAF